MRFGFRLAAITSAVAMGLMAMTAAHAADGHKVSPHQTHAQVSRASGALAQVKMEPLEQGFFFVGGHWVKDGKRDIQSGQMYVQYIMPKHLRHPYPIVMVPGTGQTGVDYFGTPDGREGWAQYFANQGYKVYVAEQPARGRSGDLDIYGKYNRLDAVHFQETVTAQENYNLFPQAHLHNQWPGGPGVMGNPSFDQFFSSQVPYLADSTKTEELTDPAIIALLERVGPSVLLVHSQAGVFGFKVADERPDLVKSLAMVEPNGPAFYDPNFYGGKEWYKYSDKIGRPYGITRLPLDFVPTLKDPSELHPTLHAAVAPDQIACYLQAEPARKLPNLAKTPIGIFTGEASYRSTLDDCTSAFLDQAGVPNDRIHLVDFGVRGNGHLMMIEKNNLEVAHVINHWIEMHTKK